MVTCSPVLGVGDGWWEPRVMRRVRYNRLWEGEVVVEVSGQ